MYFLPFSSARNPCVVSLLPFTWQHLYFRVTLSTPRALEVERGGKKVRQEAPRGGIGVCTGDPCAAPLALVPGCLSCRSLRSLCFTAPRSSLGAVFFSAAHWAAEFVAFAGAPLWGHGSFSSGFSWGVSLLGVLRFSFPPRVSPFLRLQALSVTNISRGFSPDNEPGDYFPAALGRVKKFTPADGRGTLKKFL